MHQLGLALTSRGHGVMRVNFNGGDRVAWPSLPAVDFAGQVTDWLPFLQRIMQDFAPTDMVLHGDCRPLHMAAITQASRHDVTVHVFEEGYLRPNFVTLEVGGVNGYSRLPRSIELYRQAADHLAPLPATRHVPPTVRSRAADCLTYAAACLALRPFFPRYMTHRGWPLLQEGLGWAKRAVRRPNARRRSRQAMHDAFTAADGFFVLPIQMDNDSQILCHSELGGMIRAIQLIIASFAQHAARNAVLVVKEHPLDNGVINWRDVTQAAASEAGVADRVVLIEECDLQELLDRTRGLVTVNSTSGTFALASGVPVIALGHAVYDLPGLTHRGPLETFWRAPSRPDPDLFEAFRRVVAHACLIAGDFFTADGVAEAVAAAVPRMEAAEDSAQRVQAVIQAAAARSV
jgi:capsular polysaccharide export protein